MELLRKNVSCVATAMKVLGVGYISGVTASRLLNSFTGKMLACINKRTALLITCMSKLGHVLGPESPGIAIISAKVFQVLHGVERTMEQCVLCKQHHGVWLAIGALELVLVFL
jgi:hypothetical protein